MLFCLLGGAFYLNFFLRRKLFKHGYSFLEYKFPKAILSSNWKYTLNNFERLRDLIVRDIKKLKNDYKFKKINIMGASLDCINACMVANNTPHIHEVYLIVPGHCLAESIWKGISTQKIRREYKNQGITLEELKNDWFSLAPENNLTKLKSVKISIFLSQADLIIPFYCGEKLVDKIKQLNCKLFYMSNKTLGHNFTSILFYLKPEKFLFHK